MNKCCENKEMVNSHQKDKREILRLVVIWIGGKCGIFKLKQAHMENTPSHEGRCECREAEGT